ncbi:MAG: SDR family oxidoreductase [Labilithrix sp.]|nr:SDR family oxidoreductase [Labilithrix sp.]
MSTFLVTGCGRGVGLALTKALLARGDRVIGSLRGGEAPLTHERFELVRFDVRDRAAILAAASSVRGPVDVLVNNAGIIGPRTPALAMDFDAFAETLDINVLGALRVVQAFLPHLREAPEAKVLTISSQLGSMAYPGSDRIAYRASKAALNKLMQGLALDLAADGIAVLTAHPGWVRTDMGGAGADIAPDESAAGLLALVDRLTLETTGRFLDWDGSPRPW